MQQVKGHTQAMNRRRSHPARFGDADRSPARKGLYASWLQTPLLSLLPRYLLPRYKSVLLRYEHYSFTTPLAASAYGVGRAVVDRYPYCARRRRPATTARTCTMQSGTPPKLAPAALIDGYEPAVGAATSDPVVSDASAPPGGAPGAVMQDARMMSSMTPMCVGDASTAKRCSQSGNAVASQILSNISLCYQRAFRGSCWHVAHVQTHCQTSPQQSGTSCCCRESLCIVRS